SLDPHDPSVVASTVIDANGVGSVVSFHTRETEHAVLTGFTLTGGVGQVELGAEPTDDRIYGGGVYCYLASPTIRYNVITGNHIPEEMSIEGTSSRGRISHITIPVYGCGGGIYCFFSDATIVDNLICENQAYEGGGVYIYGDVSTMVGAPLGCGTPDVSTEEGVCTPSQYGGYIGRNRIYENTANRYGGGYIRGENRWVTDNLVYGNHAESYGGLGLFEVAQVSHNTIVDNTASWLNNLGLTVYNEYSPTLIVNNIIASTRSDVGVQIYGEPYTYRFAYNVLWGIDGERDYYARTLVAANNNLLADPLFIDPNGMDYHLQPESPCVSAGDPNNSQYEGRIDIDGEDRLYAQ
ncbi:MAG: right-handed parallel beta-helix repeat-containing protein, partial [Desulfobacterales bacterium]|nr:right-handed parallel beta-helix repeat-containing protein [Desulfobacterales bacterium]